VQLLSCIALNVPAPLVPCYALLHIDQLCVWAGNGLGISTGRQLQVLLLGACKDTHLTLTWFWTV
jgi:hypothetical protein